MPCNSRADDLGDSVRARELRALMVENLREQLLPPERVLAEERARDLLLSWLTPEQRELFQASGGFAFSCKGSTTGRTYTLTTDSQFNVICDESDAPNGLKCQRYCAVFNALPGDLIGDRLLAQKIAIETDELGFLEIANKHGALYGGGVAAVFYSVPEPPPAPSQPIEQEPAACPR